ncbi:hypothetical protein [Facklamia miroungae]|uniref:Phage tail assembly chaperone protein, TAC n=1 Tax=Facklamia miroungae TaxID=120956 RepID=A0A1G7P289_9LACT|nr:hypothetical protein [Facklamia miroungae]NKZ28537.1 hypothetical protein [Facklamia miroungae]SDF79739.1 hypothetical protein SAMN05421791_10178 [Facklamia miroungae]
MNIREIKEIELSNGEIVPVKTKVSLGMVKKYQEDEIIPKDFINKMLTNNVAAQNLKIEDLLGVAFMSYKNAGGKMSFKEFEDECPLDMDVLAMIFVNMIMGGKAGQKSQFKDAITKATKK